MTIVAVHQPNFLPWSGFFAKYNLSDKFVIFDGIQPPNRGFLTRTRIGEKADKWLSCPVTLKHNINIIQNLYVVDLNKTLKKLSETIRHNYSVKKYPYAKRLFPLISFLNNPPEHVLTGKFSALSISAIYCLLHILEMDSSKLVVDSSITQEDPTSRLINITKNQGGNVYLSGSDGKKYIDSSKLPDDIFISYQDISLINYGGSILEIICRESDPSQYINEISRIQ